MTYTMKLAAKYLLGLDKANRYFAVYPDDTFLISYPRSGSTWSRFLVANLAYPGEAISFANLDQFVPATASVSRRALARMRRPRIIKCHNYFDHRYQNVIYIVRDPRDVVLSEYRFLLKRRAIPDGYPMEQFVDRFLKGQVNDYCSWKESVGSWVAARGNSERFLLLRYEDMVEQTAVELGKVARFLGIDAARDRLERAVERSSADRMRTLEQAQSDLWIVTRGWRKDIPFVGQARAAQWRSALPPNCVAAIEQAWGAMMRDLGYELTTPQPSIPELAFSTSKQRALS
jgi:Sulfotransferase domain